MGIALRRLFGNWRALLSLLLLYAVMLASLYFFISVREASVWQVLATFLLAALVPLIFFVIQRIGVRYVESDVRTKDLLRWSVRDFWKLLVATVPLLLLAWLLFYLFGKFQVSVPAVATGAGANAAARPARSPDRRRAVFMERSHPDHAALSDLRAGAAAAGDSFMDRCGAARIEGRVQECRARAGRRACARRGARLHDRPSALRRHSLLPDHTTHLYKRRRVDTAHSSRRAPTGGLALYALRLAHHARRAVHHQSRVEDNGARHRRRSSSSGRRKRQRRNHQSPSRNKRARIKDKG